MSGVKEYIESLDNKTKTNIYSVATSCIHKAVRMRMPEMVIAPTMVAYYASNWRFTHRMLVCATEDCCRDYDFIKWASENFFEKMKTVEGAVEFNIKMCEALKGKEGNFCRCALNDYSYNKIQEEFNIKKVKEYIDDEVFNAYRLEAPIQVMIQGYRDRGLEVPDWMENFLKICYEYGYDKERQGVLMPIFYNLDGCKKIEDTYDLYSKGADTTYEDMFLLNGVDYHTYIGKIALNVGKKKGMFSFFKDDEIFDDAIWHLMPGSYRGLQKQKDGYCLTKEEKSLYITEEIEKEWEKVSEDFYNLRKWAIDKFVPEFVLACKYALDREEFVQEVKLEEVKEKNEIEQLELNF